MRPRDDRRVFDNYSFTGRTPTGEFGLEFDFPRLIDSLPFVYCSPVGNLQRRKFGLHNLRFKDALVECDSKDWETRTPVLGIVACRQGSHFGSVYDCNGLWPRIDG